MARLFTITVLLENKPYGALVNLSHKGHDLACTVRYFDNGVYSILQSTCLRFNLNEGLTQPDHLNTPLAEELVIKTAEAITAHLNLQQMG